MILKYRESKISAAVMIETADGDTVAKIEGDVSKEDAVALAKQWCQATNTKQAIAALVDKYREQLRKVGGMDNELVDVPAAGVRKLLDELERIALL